MSGVPVASMPPVVEQTGGQLEGVGATGSLGPTGLGSTGTGKTGGPGGVTTGLGVLRGQATVIVSFLWRSVPFSWQTGGVDLLFIGFSVQGTTMIKCLCLKVPVAWQTLSFVFVWALAEDELEGSAQDYEDDEAEGDSRSFDDSGSHPVSLERGRTRTRAFPLGPSADRRATSGFCRGRPYLLDHERREQPQHERHDPHSSPS